MFCKRELLRHKRRLLTACTAACKKNFTLAAGRSTNEALAQHALNAGN